MSKRVFTANEQSESTTRRRKQRLKLEDAPPINSINDLIEIGKSIKFYKNLDSIMLWRVTPYLEELDNLIGMEKLKESIFYQLIYYIQNMHIRNQEEEYLHTVLIGLPGSGKTSVAKILGKIYQAMGILSKNGPFKIAHRDDFIAGYLGQTAIKTQKLLKSCIGGILFIDEIYALGPGQEDKDSFSKEAIDTLNAFLSEHTKDFCCIVAGYEEEIKKCFFAVNQGLESRFPWVHKMDKYSPEDLADIAIKMVGEIKWDLGASKEEIVGVIKTHADMFSCNGRDVRTFVSKCKMAHARRIICLGTEAKFLLIKEDFVNGLEMVAANRHKEDQQMSPSAMYMYM
jgi:replication-associated recombination protein RarA